MTEFNGTVVSEGIASGVVYFAENLCEQNRIQKIQDVKGETERFNQAVDVALEELTCLYERSSREADETVADIFMIHKMMLLDDDFNSRIVELIESQSYSAVSAVHIAAEEFSKSLEESGNDYIIERGADIYDLENRLSRILQGKKFSALPEAGQKVVLVANDITPSLTMLFEKSTLAGMVSSKGSATSHASILARSLGIPCVITMGTDYDSSINGQECIIDGISGAVIFNPDESQQKIFEQKRKNWLEEKQALLTLKDLPAVTKSGRKVQLFCNAGSIDDIKKALEIGAEGIGLFRSEFMYLGRKNLPDEDELTQIYSQAAVLLKGKKLVIRTLDIGADKQAECLPMEHEENPALGVRALRLCFARPDVFEVQLRAILRAAVYGNVSIMFPMITSISEIRRAKSYMLAAAAALEEENIPHLSKIETGIMIETPAAAIISDQLAKESDFFSLGTNDLTQYTLAVDRMNSNLSQYCDTHHEAVLRLIEMTCKNAVENNIWCGICGELGADPVVAERFINAGISELSVNPSSLLQLKKKIREMD